MIAHIYETDQAKEIRLGTNNPDAWRVLIGIRGEVRDMMSKQDYAKLAGIVNEFIKTTMAVKRQAVEERTE